MSRCQRKLRAKDVRHRTPFDIDLGTIEILPINDAFSSETGIRTVNAIQAKRGLRDLGSVSA